MSTAFVAPQSRYAREEDNAMSAPAQRHRAVTRAARSVRHTSNIAVVDGQRTDSASPDLAAVVQISEAPSARARRTLLLSEDPADRRRPIVRARSFQQVGTISVAELASLAYQGIRSGAARLRVKHLANVALFAVCVVVAAQIGLALQPAAYSGPTLDYSVHTGDSVWSIAATVNSERSLEEVVADIRQMNGIDGALQPGQRIILPTR